MDLGFQDQVTIAANSTQTLYFYLGIASTMTAAQSAASTAGGQTGSYWYSQTASDYSTWLNAGKTISTTNTGVNTAYLRNLVVIKNAQNPGDGLFPAATNPGSYGYKAWVRELLVRRDGPSMPPVTTARRSSTGSGWRPTSFSNGTWETTYNLWTGAYISFVQPEYDGVGEFLVGVYRDYQLSGSSTFLTAVWPAVQAAANFIANNVGTNGLGPEDFSIWEQTDQYNTFTEAFYVAGLRAAAHLASVRGELERR